MTRIHTYLLGGMALLSSLLTQAVLAQSSPNGWRTARPTARPAQATPNRPATAPAKAALTEQFTAQPGVGGIFLSFGRELPKTFRYRLERSPAGGAAYEPIAEPAFPTLPEGFAGRLNEAIAQMPPVYLKLPDRAIVDARYQVLRRHATADSLANLMVTPQYRIAAGLGHWDATAQPNLLYDYRLSRLSADGSTTLVGDVRGVSVSVASMPGTYPPTVLRIDTAYAKGPTATIECEVVSGPAPEVLHLYRAYYLRGEFEPVVASYYPVRSKNGRIRYQLNDATVVDKLSYAYYVVPGDYVGNRGTASAVYNVYNARPNEITFIPNQFRVNSIRAEKRLRLSWRVAPSREITSIDIFRGNEFDKTFVRIGSVSPADTVFHDANVRPVQTYFYTLVVNTAYGKTYPSARVPALLEGAETNYARPENVRGQQNGRTVTLTWDRPAGPVTGYYLYRARDYDQKPEQVGRLIANAATTVTVTDTLPDRDSEVWVYLVASVNTSYNISPLSAPVTVVGKTTVRPPAQLTARLRDNTPQRRVVNLYWTNLVEARQRAGGFRVYRRLVNADNTPTDWQLLTPGTLRAETNFWADTTIREGNSYAYMVRTVGAGEQLSAPSVEARCTVTETFPAGVRNVRLLQSGPGVVVQWDAPLDPTVERYVIYRAEAGKPLQKLTTLPRTTAQFVDKTPLLKKTNYYQILAEDSRGHASRNPDTVGLYVE
ncbi:fibronectin type III domain-containing protein [Fibrella sp. WM1]|uniref:fibronectin type III domain-containing protein n=1 Tax=Fibrella musci TaxID=3242485 RepID=UPI003521226B